jgi:hypothetical protein
VHGRPALPRWVAAARGWAVVLDDPAARPSNPLGSGSVPCDHVPGRHRARTNTDAAFA